MSTDDRLDRLREQTTVRGGREESLPVGLTLLAVVVAGAVVSPLLWLALRASAVPVGEAWRMLTRPGTIEILVNSVVLVATVTVASVLLGVPLAYLTAQTDLPFRRFWTVVTALPLVVPSYIGAFAFVSAFGPRGVLATALEPLGVDRIPVIYGFEGAALVLTLFTFPYVFLTTRASLLSLDGTLVEAARTLNHSRWEAFKRVTLPQILPGITAGALLVALYALSDYGTPAIMHYQVFTRAIFVSSQAFQTGYAALLSVQLLAITAVVLVLESSIGAGDTGTYVNRGGSRPGQVALGWWTLPATLFCAAVAVLCLVVPLGVLVMWLERAGAGYASYFSFQWSYAFNSVYAAALAAGVSVLAALPVAYLAVRYDSTFTTILDRLTYVGYAVPGVVLGLALVFLGVNYVRGLYQTLPLLVFAYVVRFLPQAVGTTRSSLLQVDPRLVEAARTLGHSRAKAFARVTLPLIAPGVAAGAALVFLTTMKELPATLMLHPIGFETLVTYIWQVRENGYYGAAAVPALVLVGISALSMGVILARERYHGR